MSWKQFYWRWFRECFRHLGSTDLFSGVIGVVLPAIAYLVPSLEGSVKDWTWQMPLAAFTAIGIVRAVVAPFVIYKERNENAKGHLDKFDGALRLEIQFNPTTHRYVRTGALGDEMILYRISVASVGTDAESVEVTATIEPISKKRERREVVGRFAGTPLMLKDDRAIPPTRQVSIPAGTSKDFDVIQAPTGKNEFHVCHAVALIPTDRPGFSRQSIREPDDRIPAGRYRITISASCPQMIPAKRVFECSTRKGAITFLPVSA